MRKRARAAAPYAASIPTFWCTPSGDVQVSLRRFSHGTVGAPGQPEYHYHSASVVIVPQSPRRFWSLSADVADIVDGHPAWPTRCEHCDSYTFGPDDAFQVNVDELYHSAQSTWIGPLRHAPPGAMWDATWMSPYSKGPDGICLVVVTPGGEWMVDSEASNCTRKGQRHQCWVRHGDPRQANVTVDKGTDPQQTCAAGAGSIQCGAYHGFLDKGCLVLSR